MRYAELVETDAQAQADAQRKQREKLSAANDHVAKASQTYQATVRAAHDSAAIAKKKLSAPTKPAVKPISPILPGKVLSGSQAGCW